MLTDDRLTVKRNQAEPKVRQYHVLGGVTGIDRTLKINNATIDTLTAALMERMYYCKVNGEFVAPPEPSVDVHARLKHFKYALLRKFGNRPTKLAPEEFVSRFRGRKLAIYTKALEEYYDEGVQRKHSVSAAFVKCEKVNPTKAPRCIQPRHPVYNIGVGMYLKHIEHRLYKAVSKVFGEDHVIMKGYNVEEIGAIVADKWESFADPIGIGLDAVKFDMHVSVKMLEWEHSIYTALYPGDRNLRTYLSWQVNNRGVGYCDDGKLNYKVNGRRFSGDMNTGLGNCLDMCGMVHTYAKERNIPIKFINNGDDCVVFMERECEEQFVSGLDEWFYQLGFRMTREPTVDVLEQVEFCQMRPVKMAGGRTTMVRNFNTAREKDSLCIHPLQGPTAMKKWLYAIGECGLALCGGVPIMQAMYKCYMRNGVISNMQNSVQMQSGMRMLAKGLESKAQAVADVTRASFFMAWGYTPDEQVALEKYYDTLVLEHTLDVADNYIVLATSPL